MSVASRTERPESAGHRRKSAIVVPELEEPSAASFVLPPEGFATSGADFLIDLRQTTAHAGIQKSQVHREMEAGRFPQPIRLGPRCTRWSLREVSAWVEQRKAERATQPKFRPIKRKGLSADGET